MKSIISFGLWPAFILFPVLAVYPFLPGDYDPAANVTALWAQSYSGLGLITSIPAALWLWQAVRSKKGPVRHFRLYPRVWFWTHLMVCFPIILITTFGISILAGMALALFTYGMAKKGLYAIAHAIQEDLSRVWLPLLLLLYPAGLFFTQMLISDPLTDWSRNRAMRNGGELIEDIATYKIRHGVYPRSLNALWKDYQPDIKGIEQYHYIGEDTTYNLYFEQPRFFFDRFGTREVVVYNPTDDHQMLSHASWHMLLSPDQRRLYQGWYQSNATEVQHWKYFWFD